jgi:hypothetical protein
MVLMYLLHLFILLPFLIVFSDRLEFFDRSLSCPHEINSNMYQTWKKNDDVLYQT